MKFILDERIKHRLTGMVVILSIAAIFIPTVVKKSNHHFEENIHLTVNLPPKPPLPNVTIVNDKAMFQSVKVAQVSIPPMIEKAHIVRIAKIEPLTIRSSLPAVPVVSKKPIVVQAKNTIIKADAKLKTKVIAAVVPTKKYLPTNKNMAKPLFAAKKPVYSVQLASFAQQKNAQLLVNRLRNKGYIANYNKFSTKQGEFYKVVVGQLNQKDAAKNLQKQLALNMQLHGFIVKTGVS